MAATKSYGAQKKDKNRIPVNVGSGFATQDATGTPKTSPLSYSGTEIAITVPTNAAEMILFPTTDLRISEVTGMARYDVIAAGTKEVIGVSDMETIYIKRDAADGSLRFRFVYI